MAGLKWFLNAGVEDLKLERINRVATQDEADIVVAIQYIPPGGDRQRIVAEDGYTEGIAAQRKVYALITIGAAADTIQYKDYYINFRFQQDTNVVPTVIKDLIIKHTFAMPAHASKNTSGPEKFNINRGFITLLCICLVAFSLGVCVGYFYCTLNCELRTYENRNTTKTTQFYDNNSNIGKTTPKQSNQPTISSEKNTEHSRNQTVFYSEMCPIPKTFNPFTETEEGL